MVDLPNDRPLKHFSHISRAHLTVFVLVFAFIGSYTLLSSHAASGPLANLWVDANGGSCTRQSAVAYNDSAACGDFQSAYNAAQAGDTVRVKCGDYSGKTSSFINISYSSSKDNLGSNIAFYSETNTPSCVTLPNTGWSIASGHVEFHHFAMSKSGCVDNTVSGYSSSPCPILNITSASANSPNAAHDAVIDDVAGSILNISGPVHNILVQKSDFGPAWDYHGLLHCNGSVNPCTLMPHDITIQDTSIHDFQNSTACKNNIPAGCMAAHHEGCALTINNGYNINFNRDHFYNCEDMAFYLHPYLSEVHDVTIENSDIGRGAVQSQIEDDYNTSPSSYGLWNIRFYNNTWGSSALLLPSNLAAKCAGQGGSGGCEWRGNIGGMSRCNGNSGFSNGWTVEYNASTAVYCGSGTLLAGATGSPTACSGTAVCRNNFKTSTYGLQADGYHLAASSPMIGILPSGLSWLPTTDIDGGYRSVNSSPGADQYGTVTQPPPGSSGGSSSTGSGGSGSPAGGSGSQSGSQATGTGSSDSSRSSGGIGSTSSGSSGEQDKAENSANLLSPNPKPTKKDNKPAVITFFVVLVAALGSVIYISRKIRGRWLW